MKVFGIRKQKRGKGMALKSSIKLQKKGREDYSMFALASSRTTRRMGFAL
jgi:hypothetical protein